MSNQLVHIRKNNSKQNKTKQNTPTILFLLVRLFCSGCNVIVFETKSHFVFALLFWPIMSHNFVQPWRNCSKSHSRLPNTQWKRAKICITSKYISFVNWCIRKANWLSRNTWITGSISKICHKICRFMQSFLPNKSTVLATGAKHHWLIRRFNLSALNEKSKNLFAKLFQILSVCIVLSSS